MQVKIDRGEVRSSGQSIGEGAPSRLDLGNREKQRRRLLLAGSIGVALRPATAAGHRNEW